MSFLKKYFGDIQVNTRWFLVLGICAFLLVAAYFIPVILRPLVAFVWVVLFFTVVDYVLLFVVNGDITGKRQMDERFDIGEENVVAVTMENSFPYKVTGFVIDELPFQFQQRNFNIKFSIPFESKTKVAYSVKPFSRGEFGFGHLLAYAATPLGLLQRRFRLAEPQNIKVYPAFRQLRKYQLQSLATSESSMPGTKKLRRMGHSLEFEKIKEYVPGDDVRTINWKATARTGSLMVNTYTDARQQQIYAIIDKGRNMKMPFEGLTLLDHSINAVLALLNLVLLKQDKAGLITFSNLKGDIIPAERRGDQMHQILETLYKQQTDFHESDYEGLWSLVHRRISQRSLLLFFTNFETMSALDRQLPYLKRISKSHLVCVVFFQNTLLKAITDKTPDTTEGIYIKTIADHFDFEKRQIVKELRRHGIISILTTPHNLNVDVINKYLELKARQMV